jgi:hypothetical protein
VRLTFAERVAILAGLTLAWELAVALFVAGAMRPLG